MKEITTRRLCLKLINPLPSIQIESKNIYLGLWEVSKLNDGSAIGCILAKPINIFEAAPDFSNIELGWRFVQSSWGNGYATEAAKRLMTELAKLREVNYISATSDKDNSASIRIMTKLGMEFVQFFFVEADQQETELVLYTKKIV